MNLTERADKPIFKIDKKVWEFTIEDARICEIEEEFFLTYVVSPNSRSYSGTGRGV